MNRWAAAVVCGVIAVLMSLWPGDAPWGGDDVWLVHEAARGNAAHRLIPAGLGGSFGYPYGPLPLQAYQAVLWVTHDLNTVVRIHAFVFAATTAGGLLWITAELGFGVWLAPLVMAGPFFWFYGRLLWDNPMAIPVGTLLLASWASLLRRPGFGRFLLWLGCAAALPMIHPMTLPLVIAVGGQAVLTRAKLFSRYWPAVAAVFILVGVSCGPYLLRVAGMIRAGVSPTANPQAGALSPGAAFAFPLLGGRLLSAYHFFDHRGPEPGWESGRVGTLCRAVSAAPFAVVWLGIVAAAICVGTKSPRNDAPAEQIRRRILSSCLVALLLQMAMDGAMKVAPFPHYFTGNWIVFVVFFWTGLHALRPAWVGNTVAVAAGFCLATSTILFAADIHQYGGGPVWYGDSLSRQGATLGP